MIRIQVPAAMEMVGKEADEELSAATEQVELMLPLSQTHTKDPYLLVQFPSLHGETACARKKDAVLREKKKEKKKMLSVESQFFLIDIRFI